MADSEKYEVLEKIGHGSFGVIQKVRRKSDGLILCRKEISYIKMNEKEKSQLLAEMQILKDVRHPNIVAYYEREHLKNTLDVYIYMEYCGNGDLGQYIKRLKTRRDFASEDFVWSILSQLVTALYRCHSGESPPDVKLRSLGLSKDADPTKGTKILHRDLKPENVFLDNNNSVKLGDFGLSKVLGNAKFAQTYVGTPFYMSPEICCGENYQASSDVWSLGCIIYELCAREPPFNAMTQLDLIEKIKKCNFRRIPQQYSDELQEVIFRCLKRNPNDRPSTMELLNHPRIKLMRKEQAIVEWAAELQKREEQLNQRIAVQEAAGASERENARREAEMRTKHECELRCKLEHAREIEMMAQLRLQDLQAQFETAVQEKARFEIEMRTAQMQAEVRRLSGETAHDPFTATQFGRSSTPPSNMDISSDPKPGVQPDINLPFESPLQEKNKLIKPAKRVARTPFGRAQTMIATSRVQDSPMDVTMADPSPMSIACLSLSPRRNQAHSNNIHASNLPPPRNIFAQAAAHAVREKWTNTTTTLPSPTLEASDDSDVDLPLDLDNNDDFPSPTRTKLGDPFKFPKATSRPTIQPRTRTGLTKGRLGSAPNLHAAKSGSSSGSNSSETTLVNASQLKRPVSAVPVIAASPTRRPGTAQPVSPSRARPRSVVTSPTRKPLTENDGAHGFKSKKGNDEMLKAAMRNNIIQGRTLVELSQARGAPVPVAEGEWEKRGAALSDVVVWDPEVDEMPSPFLARGVKSAPAGRRGVFR
ncbi:kinase-like protein [Eremomyces bilateralis CBS 781.70]|uniref:non-specific serine/threonine protein kinase n=1 Tax=Eremomyces bilateralis CBS 781.70 TaxID=1392243 RepID=A0A6G1FRX1_9PEZI|nr:kinase-like protein [Eremomyces bilateralis CBS 781.70]KAF1808595.1 kinase-like protein [Eremomyces bilateralis CBS 781.70]